jgi:hypothetical protein
LNSDHGLLAFKGFEVSVTAKGDVQSAGLGTYRCMLCDGTRCGACSWMSSAAYQIHVTETYHRSATTNCEAALNRYYDRSKDAYEVWKGLYGLTPSPSLAKAIMSHLFQDGIRALSLQRLIAEATVFKWNTALVLLELAMWKAACQLSFPTLMDVSSAVAWLSHGWKANKSCLRHNEMVTVVMQNVSRSWKNRSNRLKERAMRTHCL